MTTPLATKCRVIRLHQFVVLVTIFFSVSQFALSQTPRSRPFYMGFTPWPADLTLEGIAMAKDFAHQHGDIVSVMIIGGIPWPESLANEPFSDDVNDRLNYRPTPGKKLLLSISPLNGDRSNIAPYWGAKDNLPLPKPWDRYELDSPQVKTAFRSFVLRAVEAMQPDYLAIGIESNVLLSKAPQRWPRFKALYVETYDAIKLKHPDLPVFFTTDVLHYRHLANEAKGSDQQGQVSDLMRHSDLFAMSVYPHMSFAVGRPVPDDFLDFAKSFGKPIAISESGMISTDVELKSFNLTLRGSQADQTQVTELLLATAARDRYVFVINFATTDFEALCARLPPPSDDLARIWANTGMQTSDGQPKPAPQVWDDYFEAKHEP